MKAAHPAVLLAKSKDSRFTADELSVPGHSIRVARAARCLMLNLADDLSQLFGLDRDASELLQRVCMVASALHDIGKCGKSFQDMLQHGSRNKHPFLHELLSAALMSGPGALRDWLATRLVSLELDLMAMAAAGHHLRTRGNLATPREFRGEVLYLDHPSLLPLWQHLGRYLGVDTMPSPVTWSPSEDDIHDILADLDMRQDEVKSAFAGSRALVLPVAKAMVICADIIGSARPENQRDMEDWAGEVLNVRLDAGDLQKVIDDRLKGAKPFGFQERVRDSDERVTLVTAGCGNGKTLAAYLWAQRHARGRKLIFCYPTTGTTTAGFADYLLAQTDLERALMHSRASADIEAFQDVPAEPGTDSIDPVSVWARDAVDAWSRQVIACTVDTALGFLAHWRTSMAMMPVWAQSAFVFDEIHSYDRKLFAALLEFLRLVRAPVLLMTASLTPARRRALDNALEKELVPITGNEAIETAPRYTIDMCAPDTARQQVLATLADDSGGSKVLWVCNTVGGAARVFEDLRGALRNIPVWLYHSRFCYGDRVTRQRDVLQAFNSPGPALVVATQVCEMSLDISADLLVTELAPFPALVQRMGRLNRKNKVPKIPCPCLVMEPDTSRPYRAEELDQARARIASLGTGALSQHDLARAIASIDEPDYQTMDMPFSKQWLCTFPDGLREYSHTITLVRQEHLDTLPNPKRPTRAELVNLEISMLPDQSKIKMLERKRNIDIPVAPRGTVNYDLNKGATWAR